MSRTKSLSVVFLFLFSTLSLIFVGSSDGCGIFHVPNHYRCISLFTVISPIPGIVSCLVLLTVLFNHRMENLENEFDASNIAGPEDYGFLPSQILIGGCFAKSLSFGYSYDAIAH